MPVTVQLKKGSTGRFRR